MMTYTTRVIDRVPLIDHQSGEYPYYLTDLRQLYPELPPTVRESDIVPLGYYIVHPQTMPIGGVATEGAPLMADGFYYQTWILRDYTPQETEEILEATKHQLLSNLDQKLDNENVEGVPYTFPDQLVHPVGIRDRDRTNLLGRYLQTQILITPETPDPLTPLLSIKTADGIRKQLTAVQMEALILNILSKITTLYEYVWDLEDQINTATTLAELPIIPVSVYEASQL